MLPLKRGYIEAPDPAVARDMLSLDLSPNESEFGWTTEKLKSGTSWCPSDMFGFLNPVNCQLQVEVS
jgi:hypothetical protein